jgi:hypothetical protein
VTSPKTDGDADLVVIVDEEGRSMDGSSGPFPVHAPRTEVISTAVAAVQPRRQWPGAG